MVTDYMAGPHIACDLHAVKSPPTRSTIDSNTSWYQACHPAQHTPLTVSLIVSLSLLECHEPFPDDLDLIFI